VVAATSLVSITPTTTAPRLAAQTTGRSNPVQPRATTE
jgi:hypothetical protein